MYPDGKMTVVLENYPPSDYLRQALES